MNKKQIEALIFLDFFHGHSQENANQIIALIATKIQFNMQLQSNSISKNDRNKFS